MARNAGPRNRIARRFGVNIFGRMRNPLLHKLNPPGVHGARRRKKSNYGLQLEEKQKLKAIYGMLSEKQLVNYYKKAVKKHGNTPELLVAMLESRLDSIVYRLRLAPTPFAAHQLVSHGHVEVDGKKVDRRSFEVKTGQVVSIREKSQKIKVLRETLENSPRSVPEYLSLDAEKCSGQYISVPAINQVPWPLEISIPEICDFLAHTT